MILPPAPIVHHPLVLRVGPVEVNGFGIALVAAFATAHLIGLIFVIVGVVWMRLRRDVAPGKPGIYAPPAAAQGAGAM